MLSNLYVGMTSINHIFSFHAFGFRCQINARKNKVENYPARKPRSYSYQQVGISLSNSLNSEDFTDPTDSLSRSIRGGNINNCKTRVITFIRSERFYPGRYSWFGRNHDSYLDLMYKPFHVLSFLLQLFLGGI